MFKPTYPSPEVVCEALTTNWQRIGHIRQAVEARADAENQKVDDATPYRRLETLIHRSVAMKSYNGNSKVVYKLASGTPRLPSEAGEQCPRHSRPD